MAKPIHNNKFPFPFKSLLFWEKGKKKKGGLGGGSAGVRRVLPALTPIGTSRTVGAAPEGHVVLHLPVFGQSEHPWVKMIVISTSCLSVIEIV